MQFDHTKVAIQGTRRLRYVGGVANTESALRNRAVCESCVLAVQGTRRLRYVGGARQHPKHLYQTYEQAAQAVVPPVHFLKNVMHGQHPEHLGKPHVQAVQGVVAPVHF